MVSACAHSGAYPTGYGLYQMSTEGIPEPHYDRYLASGFTHFQQSGTGAIRKYYNYLRVTPMIEPLDALGTQWELQNETAQPGYYAATLSPGIRCEITVGARSAVHRYTFPESHRGRVVVDFSHGGLAIEHGQTVPLRAQLQSLGSGMAQGTWSWRVSRSRCSSRRRPLGGGRCCGTTGASSTAEPGWTSTTSGAPRCGRSG